MNIAFNFLFMDEKPDFKHSLNPETQAFAGRLRQALTRSPQQIRTPSELALHFNLNHGKQVTNQAVQKWLAGHSKPSPEKMETLARLCHVSAQWLRHRVVSRNRRIFRRLGEIDMNHEIISPDRLPNGKRRRIIVGIATLAGLCATPAAAVSRRLSPASENYDVAPPCLSSSALRPDFDTFKA